jgi:O-antigen/teichoic acid export membrane protein
MPRARVLHYAAARAKMPGRAGISTSSRAGVLTAAETFFGVRNLRAPGLVVYRAASDIAGKAAFLAVTVLAARRLSAGEFGVFSLGTTMGWIAAAAADFGMQAHVARAVAHHPGHARSLLDQWLLARFRSAAVVLVVAAAAIWSWQPDSAVPLVALVAVYLLSGLLEFVHHFFRGLSRSDLESMFTLWWRGAMLVLAGAALVLRPGIGSLCVALLTSAAATFVIALHRARRLAPGAAGAGAAHTWTEFRRDVFPIGLGILLSAAYFRSDVLLIGLWRGAESAGVYHASFRLVDALRLFPAAVLAVALPTLCTATSTRVLLRICLVLTACALAASLLLIAVAPAVMSLVYGPSFADATPAFRILLLAFPLMALNYALTQQLIGWNGHWAWAVVCAAALTMNLALNARWIPAFGINGAAWATVWTEAVVTSGCGAALALGLFRRRAATEPVSVLS